MEKLLVIALMMSCLFFLLKILEMKYIAKEWKPLKNTIRDSVYVFLSGFATLFVFLNMNGSIDDFMNVVTQNKSSNLKATQIFTDEPGF